MKALPDGARLEKGRGDLERLVLEAAEAEAHVYLHGAHVTHFQPRGEKPVLWVSERSLYAPGRPIRGGVPQSLPSRRTSTLPTSCSFICLAASAMVALASSTIGCAVITSRTVCRSGMGVSFREG